MRPKVNARLSLLLVLASVTVSCGGGGSTSEGGSTSLSLRALWQQPEVALRSAAGGGAQVTGGGGFGPQIPAAVRTVQLTIESGSMRCCLAIDRDEAQSTPIADPDSGRRTVILDDLPEGAASVVVRGFPSALAPAPDGYDDRCATRPAGVGRRCDEGGFATPSFGSDATAFDVVRATQVRVRDILIPALPFVVPDTLDPTIAEAVFNPVVVGFTVAIAAGAVDRQSVAVELDPRGTLVGGSAPATVPCDDSSAVQCSPGGALEVTGFRFTNESRSLPAGGASARLLSRSATEPVRSLDATYGFDVLSGAASPTATSSFTPPPTATATRTSTSTPVESSTSTATATATPTATPTSTDTPSPTITPTSTDTSTPTLTPTVTPTSTSTLTPTITPTPTLVQRVFVTNADTNDISVIDADAATVIDTIAPPPTPGLPTGNPLGIALTPDGRTLYVTNSRDDGISVLPAGPLGFPPAPLPSILIEGCPPPSGMDLCSCCPLGIDVGPFSFDFGQTRQLVALVALRNADQILIFDTASNTELFRIDLGNCPLVGCQPSRVLFGDFLLGRAFVSNAGADRVTVIDTEFGGGNFDIALECPVTGCSPDGLAVTPGDGTLLVANAGSGTLSLIRGSQLVATVPIFPGGGTVSDVVATLDGTTALVTHEDSGQLGIVDLLLAEQDPAGAVDTIEIPNCGPCVDATNGQQFSTCRPGGIDISPDGARAFIARTCDDAVSVLELATFQFLPDTIAVGDAPKDVESGTLANDLGVRISVGSASIGRGLSEVIDVTLAEALTTIVGLQNDIILDTNPNFPTGITITECTANPNLPVDVAFQSLGNGVRAVATSLEDTVSIPAGSLLYQCTVAVDAGTVIGNYVIDCVNARYSPPPPAPVPAPAASCTAGLIEVTGP